MLELCRRTRSHLGARLIPDAEDCGYFETCWTHGDDARDPGGADGADGVDADWSESAESVVSADSADDALFIK